MNEPLINEEKKELKKKIDKFRLSLNPELFQNFERYYLSIAIWPGIKDPNADILKIQFTGLKNNNWEQIGEINLYKDKQGYKNLPKKDTHSKKLKSEFLRNMSKRKAQRDNIRNGGYFHEAHSPYKTK